VATPDGRYDSEALLALPELTGIAGKRVVLVTAPDGRGRLQEVLATRGARVDEVFVYRRCPPRWDRRHHRALIAAPARRATLASSVEALAVLARQLDPAEIATLRRGLLVAASARVAAAARTQGWRDIAIAASALPRDLVGALVERIGATSRRKS
jgi:uroporphyrinogen-III synthase